MGNMNQNVMFGNGDTFCLKQSFIVALNSKIEGTGVLKCKDGRNFIGIFKNSESKDNRMGLGMYFEKDCFYSGEYLYGLKHGKGYLRHFLDNFTFDGEFSEGLFHGKGNMSFSNGDSYSGEFVRGKRNGRGVLKYLNGDVYDGFWLEDVQHGSGVLTYSTGTIYMGDFRHNQREGIGTCEYINGDSYKGEWLADKRHGRGELSFANGSTYKGSFVDGVRSGQGVYVGTAEEGWSYTGEWSNDRKEGRGVETLYLLDARRAVYSGGFKDGVYHGHGRYKYASGDIYEGPWKDGKQHGRGRYTTRKCGWSLGLPGVMCRSTWCEYRKGFRVPPGYEFKECMYDE